MSKPRQIINKVERINGILKSAKEARQRLKNLAAASVNRYRKSAAQLAAMDTWQTMESIP